jgi:hypothetical protein
MVHCHSCGQEMSEDHLPRDDNGALFPHMRVYHLACSMELAREAREEYQAGLKRLKELQKRPL